jgi:hypothetical protein
VQVPLVHRQLVGGPQRLPGGQDRDLRDRVGVLAQGGDERVAGLVHGDGVLLVGQQHVGALADPEHDPIAGVVEVPRAQHLRPSRTAKIAASLRGWPGPRR